MSSTSSNPQAPTASRYTPEDSRWAGVRSAKVAFGFAVYALVLGTVLVLTGAIVFIGQGQWLLLGLMVLIEAVFVFAFIQLVDQARNRRSAH